MKRILITFSAAMLLFVVPAGAQMRRGRASQGSGVQAAECRCQNGTQCTGQCRSMRGMGRRGEACNRQGACPRMGGARAQSAPGRGPRE